MQIITQIVFLAALAACSQTNFNTAPKAQNPAPKAASAEEQVQKTPAPSPKLEVTKTVTPLPEPVVNTVPSYGSCSTPCNGKAVTLLNAKYDKWVKVVLCSPQRYDILMGDSEAGPFYKIGDTGGHGQDHCELVNFEFSDLRSDDDIKSGNCPTCMVQGAGSVTNIPEILGKRIYSRSRWGEQFELRDATSSGIHTSCWYECGVSFP